MPVPGLNPELPLRAKVRVGEKVERQVRGQTKQLPTATDHFVCDDDAFLQVAGDNPTTLRVHFPYADWQLAFPAGLERWAKGRTTQILTCYTKGDGIAHRLTKGAKAPDGTWKIDPTPGSERREMPCAAQKCAYFGKSPQQGCRPQARLNFQLVGGPRDSVYRFETKGLNSIERITGVLQQYADLRGVEFELSVEMVKRGAKEFPVVSLKEITTEHPAVEAEPSGETATASTVGQDREPTARESLRDYLTATGRWPLKSDQVDWVLKVGPEEALRVLRERDARG